MTSSIDVDEWEEFVRCLHLGLRLRSGAQMRNVCTAELLDLKVEDIVSCVLPQDFAAHVSGTAAVFWPEALESIRGLEALPLFCALRRLREKGHLPLSTRQQHTRLKKVFLRIVECGVRGAEFYRKVALILERAANDPLLWDKIYIPRFQQQSQVDLLQLAS